MFGYSDVEALQMNAERIVPETLRAEVHAKWERLRRGERVDSWETQRKAKDGHILDVCVTATAIRDETSRPVAVANTKRDITEQKKLGREVVEIASLEQRRIGHDLHDSVGQELTALTILAGDLAETLPANPMNATKLVERLVQGLRRSQHDLRAVMRGLLPVAVDAKGLMAALSDLADRIRMEGSATCTFACPEPVSVTDNLIATHLYLIAQEAVHNAVKHSHGRSIRIVLASNDLLRLSVQDDGVGIPNHPSDGHGGLGIRIMRNRALIIGATLTIQPAKPSGTLVTCVLPRKGHEE